MRKKILFIFVAISTLSATNINSLNKIYAASNDENQQIINTQESEISLDRTKTLSTETSIINKKIKCINKDLNLSNVSFYDVLADTAAKQRLAKKIEKAKENLKEKAKLRAEREEKLRAEEERVKAEKEAQLKAEEEKKIKAAEEEKKKIIKVTSNIELTDETIDYFAKCVYCEAGNQDELGKRLVIDVILNRLDQFDYSSIEDVINAPGQFDVVANGSIKSKGIATDEIKKLIISEIKNRTNTQVLYFKTKSYHSFATPILQHGDHYFSGR